MMMMLRCRNGGGAGWNMVVVLGIEVVLWLKERIVWRVGIWWKKTMRMEVAWV